MREIDSLDDELTLYVPSRESVTPDTPVMLVNEELEGEPEGMSYLLEAYLVKDVLRVWKTWRAGREPTSDQAAEAIAYYANRDAFIPVE